VPRKSKPAVATDRHEQLNLVLEKLGLSTVGGILLAVPFAFPQLSAVHFVALIPWIVLFVHPRYCAHAAYVLPGAYIYLALSLRPLSRLHPVIPLFLAALYFFFYALFPILLKAMTRRGRPLLAIAVPIAWVLTEAVRSYVWEQQLPLYQLGTSQFRWTELIQIADFTGVYGVSFLIAAFNGALADLFFSSGWRRRIASVGIVATFFAGTLVYGMVRANDQTIRPGPRLALIQPNERHAFRRADNQGLMPRTIAFTREHVAPRSVDMIVWPENGVDDALNVKPEYLQQLSALAREKRSHLLVGAYTAVPAGHYYTSAYLFGPNGALSNRYDKVHMIFWSEYMPFEALLSDWPRLRQMHHQLAMSTLGWVGAGIRAKKATNLDIPGGRFSTPICFETANSSLWRQAARDGAEFLVNMTGEGILGTAMYTHFLAQASFRAVENRIGVVRAANNGMSAFVDPNGRIYNVLRGTREGAFYGERGVLIDRVRIDSRHQSTFYTRHGELFVFACALAAAALLIPARVYRRALSGFPRRPAPLGSVHQEGPS
jgi:apolipoprotein N-acyltransferase